MGNGGRVVPTNLVQVVLTITEDLPAPLSKIATIPGMLSCGGLCGQLAAVAPWVFGESRSKTESKSPVGLVAPPLA